jgi:type IV pilus assembly protein PilW
MRRITQPRASQRGYSLIEVSVAVVIAIFLLGGLFSILQTTRKTSGNQALLAQLQDNERIAMTLMQETMQSTGYYPNPLNVGLNVAFPAQATPQTAMAAGQILTGDQTGTGGTDTITVRFQTESTGSVLGCFGTSDTPINTSHEYRFYLAPSVVNGLNTTSLYCARDTGVAGQAQIAALVDNVTGMTVTYGVDTTGSANGINAYIPTASMSATDFLNVFSVSITLTFTNPLCIPTCQPGQTPGIVFTRVINLMSRG